MANRFKKLAAGALLTWSFLCGAAVVDIVVRPDVTPESRYRIVTSSVMLGLPALVGGSWLVWDLKQKHRQQRDARLQATFFELLQQGQGYIGVLPFALQTEFDAVQAKAYLDEQARQFDANFQVNETGQVFYYFDLSGMTPLQLAGAPLLGRCDVVLEDYSGAQRREVTKVLKQQVGCSWSEAKRLMEHPPTVVKGNLERGEAEAIRRALAAAGAKVSIRLR